jgi:serine/threonine-protein kinase RsbW
MIEPLKMLFPATLESLDLAEDIFRVVAGKVTSAEHLRFRIRMILSEAFSNAYLHGRKAAPGTEIEVSMCFKNDKFFVSIINEGSGFAENDIKWDDFPSAEAESGRGLMIIRRLCDRAEFKRIDNGRFGVFMEINIGKNDSVKCQPY